MALMSQARLMRALREMILGDARTALPQVCGLKPSFYPKAPKRLLPRSTPEEQGLSSEYLDAFYRDIAAAPGANAHSLLVARNGHVVSEGYFAPYRRDVWHVTHSLCKSFTGTAVGLAIEEGLFSLDDPIHQYFDEKPNFFNQKRFQRITVRHLLTMSSGISLNEVSELVEPDWVKGIFLSDVVFEPGSRFVYNSMNSYLLAVLVNRTSGRTLMEYLMPRIFEPMGFGPVGWETAPNGVEKGGWGMYMMVEDMAKLGQLYLNKGRWEVEGETLQLLPETWVEQATTTQITSEIGEEYGFQMWTDKASRAFIMNGMFGQYVTCLPRTQTLIAMTAGNAHLLTDSAAYTLMRDYFVDLDPPAFLPENAPALHRLRQTTAGLQYGRLLTDNTGSHAKRNWKAPLQRWREKHPPLQNGRTTPAMRNFCGTTWEFGHSRAAFLPVVAQAMNNNFSGGIKALRLEDFGDSLMLFWEEDEGTLSLPIGIQEPLERTVFIGGESFLVSSRAFLRQNEDEEDVLVLNICLLEHSSSRIIKLQRRGDKLLLLRMDEHPQLSVALEKALMQTTATTAGADKEPALGRWLKNSDYVAYVISQICTPSVTGTVVTKPDPIEEVLAEPATV